MTRTEKALKSLIKFTELNEYEMREIKEACVSAIADHFKLEERREKENWDWDDVWRLERKADSLAHEILEILGYKVDHYFCGTPILKEVDRDE